jgi:hypothetical protein
VSLPEPVDAVAFDELERMVRALGDELARFRKRALHAEARLRELEAEPGRAHGDLFSHDRIVTLEAENRDLRERVETAAARTRAVLDRVRFLRQQTEAEAST